MTDNKTEWDCIEPMHLSDWQFLNRLLKEKRDCLMPPAPKPSQHCRKGSQAYIDAVSAWMASCEEIDDLLEKVNAEIEGGRGR